LSLCAAAALSVAPARAEEANSPFDGLYVGLHVGYSWQDVGGEFDNLGTGTNLSRIDLDGAIIGGQLGYNIKTGMVVVGIEGDATAHMETSDSVVNDTPPVYEQLTGDVAYLASLRGRLGLVVDQVMYFATVGVGFTEFKFSENAPATPFMGSLRLQESGLVYGGGVEWQVIEGVTVRGEYLHYDVGGITYIPTGFPAADPGDYIKYNDIDVARATVNISLEP
jgi:outer membrane immunogenic protein